MKNFILIFLIALAASFCTYGVKTNTVIDTVEFNNFFTEKEYRNYTPKDLETFIKEMAKHGIDINAVSKHLEPEHLNSLEHGNIDTTMSPHTSTLLGYCTCRDKYDIGGYAVAEVLVNNGAKLSGAYDDKFGFYFIKRVIGSFQTSRNLRIPTTKAFETLLYGRVAYCLKKSHYIYLIAHRINNKKLYPNLSSYIPKFVADQIAHYITAEGVLDVMNVCNEEFIEIYKEFESGKQKNVNWTMFSYWEKFLKTLGRAPGFEFQLKTFNAQEWQNDFNEFMDKKRNKEWQPGGSNLIIRSMQSKKESCIQNSN